MSFDIHIFCCTNQRDKNNPKGCCASKGAEDLRNYLKNKAKNLNTNLKIRINQAGCLDFCEKGPVIVEYPEGKWHFNVTKEDADKILDNIS